MEFNKLIQRYRVNYEKLMPRVKKSIRFQKMNKFPYSMSSDTLRLRVCSRPLDSTYGLSVSCPLIFHAADNCTLILIGYFIRHSLHILGLNLCVQQFMEKDIPIFGGRLFTQRSYLAAIDRCECHELTG